MKLRPIAVAIAALALAGSAFAQDTTSEKGKLSYYFGYDYGNNLAELQGRGEQIDAASVVKGLQDALAKKQPAITADQLKPALEAFQKRAQARAQQAKAQYDKAAAVYEGLRAKGELTEEREYRNLMASYLSLDDAQAKAIEIINEGLQKNILKPDHQTYVALAQAYYFGEPQQIPQAIEAYQKAAPLAPTGETYLNLSKLLANEGRLPEAKQAEGPVFELRGRSDVPHLAGVDEGRAPRVRERPRPRVGHAVVVAASHDHRRKREAPEDHAAEAAYG